LIIDQLVGFAISSIGFSVSWEILQTNAWTEPQLARLQRAWESVDMMRYVPVSLEVERAMALDLFARMRSSHQELVQALDLVGTGPPARAAAGTFPTQLDAYPGYFWGLFRDGLLGIARFGVSRLWAYVISDYDERHYLEWTQTCIDLTRLAATSRNLSALSSKLERVEARRDGGWMGAVSHWLSNFLHPAAPPTGERREALPRPPDGWAWMPARPGGW